MDSRGHRGQALLAGCFAWGIAGALALGAGCDGCGGHSPIGAVTPDGGGAGGSGGGGASGGRDATAGDGDGARPDGGLPDGDSLGLCPSGAVPPAPLRRLTRFEYANTVRELLGVSARVADILPADGETSVADQLPLSAAHVQGYHDIAHQLAIAATASPASVRALAGCDPTAGDPGACRQALIERFVPLAFRRPIEPAEVAAFGDVFAAGQRLGGDFASGARAVVEVALQSPELLYRVEVGEPAGGPDLPSPTRPTPYEMASRLSYLLLGSPPDETLRAAAAAGMLREPAQIAAQARRLLADPRAHEVVRYVAFQILGLNDLDLGARGLEVHIGFTPAIGALMMEETRRFVDQAAWSGPGSFEALLEAPFTFVNGPLARFYGIPGVDGDAFVKVDVDPAQRAGLLTQGSVLASTSRAYDSPTFRGKLVFERILCGDIPPEPPLTAPPPPAPQPAATTRERYQEHVANPTCAVCHRDMDPIGFGYLNFDAVGRWRTVEGGQPVDASGEIYRTDAAGTFNGPVELAHLLAASQTARDCYVRRWFMYAYGRDQMTGDGCSRRQLLEAFARSGGDVQELLVALTQTEAFLYRPSF